MRPFSEKFHLNEAFQWLARNATGECSILVQTELLGTLVYVYRPWIGTLFRRLYGPTRSLVLSGTTATTRTGLDLRARRRSAMLARLAR